MSHAKAPKTKLKLTDAAIRALSLPEGRADMLVWDAMVPGLALRIGRQRRAWTYVFRPRGGGAPQKLGLGAWPAVTVAAARQAAQIEAGRVARGEDPAAALREARRREVATVASVLDSYETSLERRAYANLKTVMSTLRRGLAHHLSRDVASLKRVELVGLFDRLEKAGKPGASADLRKQVRTLLEWTTNRGTTPHNVLAGLRRERATKAERIAAEERGRALTDDELAKLWKVAAPETVLGRYIRALVLTGARRAEMARLEWAMVGEDRLTLPPSHTKQGRPHEIPLTGALRAVLEGCERRKGRPVFASPLTGDELKGWTKFVAKLRANSGVTFTLHDLRRTMRSGLTSLGVDHDTAELMIGHQRDDLVRRYDKADRWPARVDAAERWAVHVLGLAERDVELPEKAIPLNSRKARPPKKAAPKERKR